MLFLGVKMAILNFLPGKLILPDLLQTVPLWPFLAPGSKHPHSVPSVGENLNLVLS